MRDINHHIVAGDERGLAVLAVDNPPPGFAHCRFDIVGFNTVYNPGADDPRGYAAHFARLPVIFQSQLNDQPGAPRDGVTVQALLTVCGEHLASLQRTGDASPENSRAMQHLTEALRALNERDMRVAGHATGQAA